MLVRRIRNPILRNLAEWAVSIVLGVLLFLIVRSFVFRLAHVEGNSMEPTLIHGDMVILNRFSYLFSEPRLGDIVAFPYPQDPSEFYIKRIVAAPGDVVDLLNGAFYVNGSQLQDAFSDDVILAIGDVDFPVIIEDGRFFVLGDNRNGSVDSRFRSVGTVHARDMVGRVAVRVWPMSRLGQVD